MLVESNYFYGILRMNADEVHGVVLAWVIS